MKEGQGSGETPSVHEVTGGTIWSVSIKALDLLDDLQEWLDSALVELLLVHARTIEIAKFLEDLVIGGGLSVHSRTSVSLQKAFDDMPILISEEGKVPDRALVGGDGMSLRPASIWRTE